MQQQQKRALFIGLTTIDIQYFTEDFPTRNTKVKTDAPLIAAGGPAANAAITFASLGGQVDFLTSIGKHSFTDAMYCDLEKYGVNIIDVNYGIETSPIVSAIITANSDASRTIVTHHPGNLTIERSIPEFKLTDYQLVFIDGFYAELAQGIIQKANELSVPVVFDGGSWKPHLPELLPYISMAICSANFHPPECTTDESVIRYLKKNGATQVAISKGNRSIVCENSTIPVEPVDAVDTLGAGDVLHGAFCWFLLQGSSFETALHSASSVASYSVRFKGTHQWIHSYKKDD